MTTPADLVALARRGDPLAWTRLVREHEEVVFRLALLKLGDYEEARDVAQDTFVRAFRKISKFEAERPLRPWLLQIARRLAANRRRGLGRYRHLLMRMDVPEPIKWGTPVPDSQVDVWRAVHRLPQRAQDLIWLRYFLELSESETAATLGVALGTVKSRTHRALKQLESIFVEHYPELVPEGVSDD